MHATDPRLAALADALQKAGIDLYLQPMADEFQGEYTPACAARLPFLTGFTGSAGLGAFWAKPHGARRHTLFVDGRYVLQAPGQVSRDVAVVNSGDVTLAGWLEQHAPSSLAGEGRDEGAGHMHGAADGPLTQPSPARGEGFAIGFDPWLVTQSQLEGWQKAAGSQPIEWKPIANPVDTLWSDRPAPPAGEVELQPVEFAGIASDEKRAALLEMLGRAKADAVILTLPDGINWLLNLRGSDIPFNPLLLSYMKLESNGQATLYTFERTFVQSVNDYLKSQDIQLDSLANLWSGKTKVAGKNQRVMIDPSVAAHGFWQLAEAQGFELVRTDDPTLLPKARKHAAELDGIRAAHQRDGLALSKFLHWFDAQVGGGKLPDELEVVEKLESFRRQSNMYRQPSFATIAGAGPNGAIVHYHAEPESNRRLKKGDLLLLDSGGQYPDGTTDVTRTISTAEPTTAMKENYTRVLKGHIALATAVFPAGTSGQQLDTLARQYLWQAGLDYDHGTGHGVGAYLCVHEGPARIAKKGSSVPLEVGMILSNEPGYYEAGKYGIRIENLVTVIRVGTTKDGKDMLGFETLTLAPIDTRLVEVKMLTSEERNWLNDYHRRVCKAHASALDYEEKRWLEQATRAI